MTDESNIPETGQTNEERETSELIPPAAPSRVKPYIPQSASPKRRPPTDLPPSSSPSYIQSVKGARMRRTSFVVAAVALVFIVALVLCLVQIVRESSVEVYQQDSDTVMQQQEQKAAQKEGHQAKTTKRTEVPNLVVLLGEDLSGALAAVGHGATITASSSVAQADSPVRTMVTVTLTTEVSEANVGSPDVYLGLDENGHVVQSGYSVSIASLGYGAISFGDALMKESIIQTTLLDAGLTVTEGTITLPADKAAYSLLSGDGTTTMRENMSFSGTGTDDAGEEYRWDAVLNYDYTQANATGNLANTIRQVYVYVNA